MRSLRVPLSAQLPLEGLDDGLPPAVSVWARLPEPVRERTLVLLAGMIAHSVVLDDADEREPEVGR